jgi:RHS repeat-associated protein
MYDPDDQRVWSFQVGVSPRFDRWTLRGLDGSVKRTLELTAYNWSTGWSSGNTWEDHIYRGPGLLLGAYPSSAQRRTMSLDHLGTPRLVTNGGGNQTAFHAYLPYGEEVPYWFGQDCGTPPCERTKFTGQERDLASSASDQDDLDYMHARHYNLLTGRFLSLDSHAASPNTPQSWNRYAYTRGNPLRLLDKDGKEAITFQITTYIQQPVVAAPHLDLPPVTLYLGGMKTTQTFTVETDPKNSTDPIVDSSKKTFPTTRMDLNGNPVQGGQASDASIILAAGRDSSGNAQVLAGAAAGNPLEPMAPPIEYSIFIQPDQAGTSFTYDLSFGGYPSIDISATNEANQTVNVFHSDESTSMFAPLLLFCGPLGCGQTESGTVSFYRKH